MRVTLYPINAVTQGWQNDPFDHSKLPAQIVPGVTIEDVKSMFNVETFSWVGTEMGRMAANIPSFGRVFRPGT